LGKSEEAITWYDKALAVDPGFVSGYIGQPEEAITWYDKH